MDENGKKDEVIMIPMIKAESDCARYERIIGRLVGVIILLVICFTGYVVYDKWDSAQWDYADTTETVDVITDGGGDANYIKNGGEIINGTSASNDKEKDKDKTEQAAKVDD